MPIAYRSRAQVGSTTATATVAQADFDAAPQAGDLLVATATGWGAPDGGTDPSLTTPTGWTRHTFIQTGDGTAFDDGWLGVFTKAWTSGDTTYAFTNTSGALGVTVEVVALSGADTTTPNAGTSTGAGTGTSQTVASVTAAVADCLLVAAAATWGTTTAYSSTGTMTQRGTASTTGGGFTRSVAATEALTASGATGTRTFTAGAAGTYWASAAIAVRPFVAPTTSTGSPGTARTFPLPPQGPDPLELARSDDDDYLIATLTT